MRNKEEIDVNVHRREFQRHKSNGSGYILPEMLDTGEAAQSSQDTWLSRLLPHPEVLEVAGKQVSGFVVPHWAAGTILAAILTAFGVMYSQFSTQLSSQRDMLIEMKTQLTLNKEHDLEYRSEQKTRQNVLELQINNITSQYNTIKGLLTPQQLRYLEKNSRKMEN